MPCNQAVSNQILTVYQTQQPEILTVSKQEDGAIVPFLKDHQIWGDNSSHVDLEAPAEEGTTMGIVVGFGWCVLCAGQI
jgi:hypothetical protein